MATDFTAAIVHNRCPACGRGPLFARLWRLHETCSECGARYERWAGSWTGSTVVGYGIGAVVGILATMVLWRVNGLAPGSEYWIAGVAVLATLASYRHAKAWWIAMMHQMGYVFPDPPTDRGAEERP